MKVIISSKPEDLEKALSKYSASVTIEAEYGDVCVEGSVLTLAHHGSRSGNPAPCLHEGSVECDVVGVSHIDLDTLGGIMSVLGIKPGPKEFWELVGFVDVNGPHKLSEANASEQNENRLYACWAWAKDNRIVLKKDSPVLDITEKVYEACEAITAILNGDESLLKEGEKYKKEGEKLNEESFVDSSKRAILRTSDSFVNHLYKTPEGDCKDAVVAYNSKLLSVTVSFASPTENDDACQIVQAFWGSLAGGHKGIAGSPRGQKMTFEDAKKVFESLTS